MKTLLFLSWNNGKENKISDKTEIIAPSNGIESIWNGTLYVGKNIKTIFTFYDNIYAGKESNVPFYIKGDKNSSMRKWSMDHGIKYIEVD